MAHLYLCALELRTRTGEDANAEDSQKSWTKKAPRHCNIQNSRKDQGHQPLKGNHTASIPTQSENGIVASSICEVCIIRKIMTHTPEQGKLYLSKYNLLCRGMLWVKTTTLALNCAFQPSLQRLDISPDLKSSIFCRWDEQMESSFSLCNREATLLLGQGTPGLFLIKA